MAEASFIYGARLMPMIFHVYRPIFLDYAYDFCSNDEKRRNTFQI